MKAVLSSSGSLLLLITTAFDALATYESCVEQLRMINLTGMEGSSCRRKCWWAVSCFLSIVPTVDGNPLIILSKRIVDIIYPSSVHRILFFARLN